MTDEGLVYYYYESDQGYHLAVANMKKHDILWSANLPYNDFVKALYIIIMKKERILNLHNDAYHFNELAKICLQETNPITHYDYQSSH